MILKFFKKENLRIKSKRGFALLFAVLTASLLMSLGLSIFGISIKELSLTTASKDSQIAFYAADSARECALYWDLKVGAFESYIDSQQHISTSTTGESIYCNNGNPISLSTQTGGYPTFSFSAAPFLDYASSTDNLNPDADLFITKTYDSISNRIITTIDTYGHNVGINGGKRVERGIEQTNIN